MSKSPTAEGLLAFIKETLAEIAPEAPTAQLSVGSNLFDLEVESVTLIELVAAIEEDLDISLPDDELTQLGTVEDLAACIRRHQSVDV